MDFIKSKAKSLEIPLDNNKQLGESYGITASVDELQGETLLKTIKVPTNLANLSSRLPRSNYEKTRHSEHSVLANMNEKDIMVPKTSSVRNSQ